MAYFASMGYDVLGMDFSRYGIEHHNPAMLENFLQGNILDLCAKLGEEGKGFGVVNLDNVLEHVTDPKKVLELCAALLVPGGLLLVRVPNDFNPLQLFLLNEGLIKKRKWIAYPDHISYFNRQGLKNLCADVGLVEDTVLGDQWIEFFALHQEGNYYDFPEKGKACHFARMRMEKLLRQNPLDKVIKLSQALGDMGLGRELVTVFHKP